MDADILGMQEGLEAGSHSNIQFENMLRILSEFEIALGKSLGALLWPVIERDSKRVRSLWHRDAVALKNLAIQILKDRQRISIDRRGLVARFITDTLERATGITYSPGAIATALRKTPFR